MKFKVWEVPRDPDSTVEKNVVFKTEDHDEATRTFIELAGKNPQPQLQSYVLTESRDVILYAG